MAWTTPRTWVAGEVVTASMMNEQVRDNLSYLKDHVDATSGVHGLGSGVYVIGSKLAQCRMEYKSVSITLAGTSEAQEGNITWTNAFSSSLTAIACGCVFGTTDYNMGRNLYYVKSASTTGATLVMAASGGKSGTFAVTLLAFGI